MSYIDKLMSAHASAHVAQRKISKHARDAMKRAYDCPLIDLFDYDEGEVDDLRDAQARYSIAH